MGNFIRVPMLVLAFAVVLTGCRETDDRVMDEDAFIIVMYEVQKAAQTAATDTARFEVMRDSILEDHGVTAADLRAFAEATYNDSEKLAAVWDSIGILLTEESLQ